MFTAFFVVFFFMGVLPLAIAGAIAYFARPHVLRLKAKQRAEMEHLTQQARADLLRRHGQ